MKSPGLPTWRRFKRCLAASSSIKMSPFRGDSAWVSPMRIDHTKGPESANSMSQHMEFTDYVLECSMHMTERMDTGNPVSMEIFYSVL